MDIRFAKSLDLVAEAEAYFGTRRTEADLAVYLRCIPEGAGWTHALLPTFQRARGQKAVLVLLLCAKEHQYINLWDAALADNNNGGALVHSPPFNNNYLFLFYKQVRCKLTYRDYLPTLVDVSGTGISTAPPTPADRQPQELPADNAMGAYYRV